MTGSRRRLFALALFAAFAPGRQAFGGEPPHVVPDRPTTYGTAVTTYYDVDAASFSPMSSAFHYGCLNFCQLRYVIDNTGQVLSAPVHLPGGAAVVSMEIDYYDGSSTGEVSASLLSCDGQDTCVAAAGSCLSTVCSGVPDANGFYSTAADLSASPVVIDNVDHRYFIVAGNSTLDGSTAISQVILGYVLQVSPSTAFVHFGDVPTSHPLFQYIEALAWSGITGGCGGDNYCPNAPLTRGQMAVFLSKALGLQWP